LALSQRRPWVGHWTPRELATCSTRIPSTPSGTTWRVVACPVRTARWYVPPASVPRSKTSATSREAPRSGGWSGTRASPPTSPTLTAAACAPRRSRVTSNGPHTSSPRGWTSSTRRDASAAALPTGSWAAGGTHALGLAAVVELGRARGRLPRGLVVVGVEAVKLRPRCPPVGRGRGSRARRSERRASSPR
jgi:hypothetical protein